MKSSIENKLTELIERFEEVGHLLSDPSTIADKDRFRELSREYARLEPVTSDFRDFQQVCQSTAEAQEMLDSNDPEIADLAGLMEEHGLVEVEYERSTDGATRIHVKRAVSGMTVAAAPAATPVVAPAATQSTMPDVPVPWPSETHTPASRSWATAAGAPAREGARVTKRM